MLSEQTTISPAAALALLFHHRWALPVFVEVGRRKGAKFVTLSKGMGISSDSLKRALVRLSELDLVVHNPGYGHPMRPEYVLGDLGQHAFPDAARLWRGLVRRGVDQVALKKWTLPALLAIGRDASRFSEIEADLPAASPRAVTLALKALQASGLAERRVEPGYPPSTRYRATRSGRPLVPLLERLGSLLRSG